MRIFDALDYSELLLVGVPCTTVCTQVTCEYRMEKGACVPVRVHTVVISVQHSDDVSVSQLRKELMDKVVLAVIPRQYIDSQTVFHLQPSGRFVIGGPQVVSYCNDVQRVYKSVGQVLFCE